MVAIAYALTLLGAYLWWILQSPQARLLACLLHPAPISPDLEHVPWRRHPASSIWSGTRSATGWWSSCSASAPWSAPRPFGDRADRRRRPCRRHRVSEGITAPRIAAGNLSGSAEHMLDVGPSYAVAACATAVVFSSGANRGCAGPAR